jgi:hypothetical protein
LTREYLPDKGSAAPSETVASEAEARVAKKTPEAKPEKRRRGRAARREELEARRQRLEERRGFPAGPIEDAAISAGAEQEGDIVQPLPKLPPPEPSTGRGEWTPRSIAKIPDEKAVPETPAEDFLARGPDEDFTFLKPEKKIGKPKSRWAAARGKRKAEPLEGTADSELLQGAPAARVTAKEKTSGDLISDVVSTLMLPEGEALVEEAGAGELPLEETPEEIPGQRPAKVPREKRKRPPREKPIRVKPPKPTREEIEAAREARAERWGFLAQPRTAEDTFIASSKVRATLFMIVMLAVGAVLWAVPNAFIIPRDQEYGLHSLLIGIIIGLVFWWKAGKKHGNKLAVQAALVTFFSLFIGEFLHWFLIIVKNQAFRTIFFDLISFKFLWENGAQIMKNLVEAMFPMAFLWILLLPAAAAFLIGFGMPPIPEIFFQIGRAFKGASPSEDPGHGLEN